MVHVMVQVASASVILDGSVWIVLRRRLNSAVTVVLDMERAILKRAHVSAMRAGKNLPRVTSPFVLPIVLDTEPATNIPEPAHATPTTSRSIVRKQIAREIATDMGHVITQLGFATVKNRLLEIVRLRFAREIVLVTGCVIR